MSNNGYQPHNNVVNDGYQASPVVHQNIQGQPPQHIHAQPAVATQQQQQAPRLPEFTEKSGAHHSSSSDRSHPSSDETRAGTSNMEYGKHESAPDASNQEYSNLLQYIQDSANARRSGANDEEEGGNKTQYKRVWYAPWKKNKVTLDKDGNVVSAATAFKTPEAWLDTDMRRGLSEDEVKKRRAAAGWNELESKRENMFVKFLSFFTGPILYVMEIAVVLAAGLEDWIDFGVIIGILFLNAFVGWYQEKAAGDIVEQLKSGIALRATVIRDGQEHEMEAREIVPGDIVVIVDGQTIPADGKVLADYEDKDGSAARRILQGIENSRRKAAMADNEKDEAHDDEGIDRGPPVVSADQSGITGESLAVDKHVGDILFFTTGCKRGECYMLVTETAKSTFVGKTAALVSGENRKGHFQIVMTQIGTALLVFVIVWLLIVWIGGFFRSVGISRPKDNNLLVYSLIFLIIGVPVGLPCVTTTTLAVGAAYLAKREAIVQKLTAIEALAGVDILCSDKTGTLTANKLSIDEPYVCEGVEMEWMMAVAALASSHSVKSLDPIDKVTIQTLAKYPRAQDHLREGWTTQKFIPFDPVSKRITAEVSKNGKKYIAAKGAPNAILKLCQPPKEEADSYRARTMTFAKRGFRSLGVALNEDGKWKLLGLLPMFDPPRGDTAATIREAGVLGIKVKMLTGDAVAIAIETCKQLGVGTKVYDSQKLISGGDGMSGSTIHDFVEAADGFGEVYPEHKYQVVELLQDRHHLVAMTGDGTNDAPSLKRADCGIAVEGATDAARAAADVVFLGEGLSTIITAIKVSRQIFHRMKAYIEYRIALCLHLEIYLTLSILILNEVIRVDLIVFLAIFADVATIAIAYDNAPVSKQPVEWQQPKIWIISSIMGILLAMGTWILRGTLFVGDEFGYAPGIIYGGHGVVQNFGNVQSILFLEVALTENWLIFVTRGGSSFPSFQLIGAILGVDILASIFTLFGWLAGTPNRNEFTAPRGGWTDIVTVVRVWIFSFGVVVICALVYTILNAIPWLANLGRRETGKKNTVFEDFAAEIQRLTAVHNKEQDSWSFVDQVALLNEKETVSGHGH